MRIIKYVSKLLTSPISRQVLHFHRAMFFLLNLQNYYYLAEPKLSK